MSVKMLPRFCLRTQIESNTFTETSQTRGGKHLGAKSGAQFWTPQVEGECDIPKKR
jgi:hypothetical protein